MRSVLIGSLLSFLLTCLAISPLSRFAWRIGAIDMPGEHRRMHRRAVPRIGGIAIMLGFFGGYVLLFPVERTDVNLFAGGSFLMLVGLIDDIYTISPTLKLAAQMIAAVIGCGFPSSLMGALSVFWVLLLCNAHNFIDGIDGLFAGCAAVESFALALSFGVIGGDAAICVLLGVSCLAFRAFNRHPARIFAGDCGSMSVGYLLAVQSLPLLWSAGTYLEFLSPLFLFAYPITDVTTSVLRRVLRGKSPFSADRGHLHHRICDGGVDQVACGRILIGLSTMLSCVGVLLSTGVFYLRGSVLCVLTALGMVLIRRTFFAASKL